MNIALLSFPAFLTLATLEARASEASEASLVRRYAIVMGVNQPAREGQTPLRYADDDAVRFYALFRQFSGETALFSLLDEETQRLYPEVVSEAELPEKQAILDRLDQMFARMALDAKQGHATELYLVYSGHGYVSDNGEGHLGLHNATFSRTELYDRILSRSTAKVNHLIVDACDAYFFVQSRGGSKDMERLLTERAQEFMDRQSIARFPNTGAILSTASAAETHEWSEIRAGVFSHEVRSAMIGAADADGDGKISYEEIESFVLAANAGVHHAEAERAVFVRPPDRNRSQAVIDLAAVQRANRLHLSKVVEGRIAVADEQGRRYADLHKAPGYELALRLIPGSRYLVRVEDTEYGVPGDKPDVYLAELSSHAPTMSAKGGIADAYQRGLFALPFGPDLVRGFQLAAARQDAVVISASDVASRPLRTAGWLTAGAATIAGGLAAGSFIAGNAALDRYQSAALEDVVERDRDVRAWDTRTSVAFGAAVSLGVAAGVFFVLDLFDAGSSESAEERR